MNKKEIKEVTAEKWLDLVNEEEWKARNLAEERGLTDYRWFFSTDDDPPCIYKTTFKLDWFRCPFAGAEIYRKPLPTAFNTDEKDGVHKLYHASDVTCIELDKRRFVRCYCRTYDDEFFVTTHRVGECPWKE